VDVREENAMRGLNLCLCSIIDVFPCACTFVMTSSDIGRSLHYSSGLPARTITLKLMSPSALSMYFSWITLTVSYTTDEPIVDRSFLSSP
jgi:hypothetical protein